MLLPGLPIPGFGMGKDMVEVISPPTWVAASALALDTLRRSSLEPSVAGKLWKVKWMGNAKTAGSCQVVWGSRLAQGLPQMCALCRRKTSLGEV